ncbi:MAG: carbohydrate ABC transporter permease [Clostridiaceae bacterium]
MKKLSSTANISYGWNIFLNITTAAYTLLCILPFLLVIIVSFTDEKSLVQKGYSFIPSAISFDAYKALFSSTNSLFRVYAISIFVTVLGTILSVLIMSMYAYPISRSSFRYRNQFTFYIFFTMLFGGGLVPWYIVCTQVLHLKNTIWALIIPYLFSPFYVIVIKTFFKTTIHESIIESAKLDGASEFRIFRAVIMPLSLPVLASIGLFTSINYWNDWWLSTILQSNDKWINLQYAMYRVLINATYLAQLSGASGGNTQSALARMPTETTRMAMCTVAMGPIILAYPFFQRYFVTGLTIGSIKG